MNRFYLVRTSDVTGVSGSGVVAEGVMFFDGTCSLRWRTQYKSTALYDSAEELIRIHGHEGATMIKWIDDEPVLLTCGYGEFNRGRADFLQDQLENVNDPDNSYMNSKSYDYRKGYNYSKWRVESKEYHMWNSSEQPELP